MRTTKNDLIGDEEDRTNEQEFAGMNVMKGEALSYERRRKGKNSPQRMLQAYNG